MVKLQPIIFQLESPHHHYFLNPYNLLTHTQAHKIRARRYVIILYHNAQCRMQIEKCKITSLKFDFCTLQSPFCNYRKAIKSQ